MPEPLDVGLLLVTPIAAQATVGRWQERCDAAVA
jgi:hypothetical protein